MQNWENSIGMITVMTQHLQYRFLNIVILRSLPSLVLKRLMFFRLVCKYQMYQKFAITTQAGRCNFEAHF